MSLLHEKTVWHNIMNTRINVRKKEDGWHWYITDIDNVMHLHEAGPFKIEALARKDILFCFDHYPLIHTATTS